MKRLALLLALFVLYTSGYPQDTGNNGPEGKVTISSDEPSKGLATLVNLDADDAFLPKILSVLAEISGYNIVTGPEVNNRQRISIHLKNAPIEEAINLVVRAAGLSYEIVGNAFLVTQHDNLKKEVGVSSYIIELQYALASELKELLKNLTENIQVAEGKNALLISTSPKVISEIRKIVETIDKPSQQIMLQTRVIEVAIDDLKEIGIDWEKLSRITTIIAENPYYPDLGGVAPGDAEIGAPRLGELPERHIFQKIDGLENVGYFSRQLWAFNVTLDWLLKTNKAKLLTDAKLTTMNNRKATIHIGEVVPFVVQSEQTAQVEREEIGIKIEITPQINRDGFITAKVKPEVSGIIELINGEIPHKKIRTAETTVIVKNQQKIIIAGLINNEQNSTIHKAPFFGNLAFFGKYFQHEVTRHRQTDLIIEITPYILNNREDLEKLLGDTLLELSDPIKKAMLEEERREKEDALNRPDSKPEGPTHMAFVPTSDVLKPYQYVISAHEISLGQLNGVQLFFTPWQNIGKLLLGAKLEVAPTLALGLGLHQGNYWGESAYTLGSRFGTYLVKGLVDTRVFDWYLEGDAQFGKRNSFGGGTAIALRMGILTLMGEFTNTYTVGKGRSQAYWDPWGTAAARVQWPWLKSLSFDAGLSAYGKTYFTDFPVSRSREDYLYMIYADIAYSGIFQEGKKSK